MRNLTAEEIRTYASPVSSRILVVRHYRTQEDYILKGPITVKHDTTKTVAVGGMAHAVKDEQWRQEYIRYERLRDMVNFARPLEEFLIEKEWPDGVTRTRYAVLEDGDRLNA